MNKRTFIKASTALAGAAIASRFSACNPAPKKEALKNWAGNLEYSTGNVHYPKTVAEVQDVVKKCKKIRPLGSRHSFNNIADSTENQLSLQEMNKVVSLNKENNTVTIEGGMRYGELAPY